MGTEDFEEIVGSEIIQDNFLFKNLNFEEAQNLARICHQEQFKKGETIIEENALGQALYLVENGEVRVIKGEGSAAKEITRLGAGQLFGEMSLIEDELTSATVVAATDVRLLVIRRNEFEDLLANNQALALKVYKSFCKTLSERLRKTTAGLSLLQPAPKKAKTAPAHSPKPKKKTRSK
jgi:CRP/FNR family cyclic AMP-dependent transcriptional regulator